MPNFVAKTKDGKAMFVELCPACAKAMLRIDDDGEVTLCEKCCKAAERAGLPLRKPRGPCAWCGEQKELTQEYTDHPEVKLCEQCAPKGVLKPRRCLCHGCMGVKKNVYPAMLMSGRLFGLCKPCDNRLRPSPSPKSPCKQ